MKLEISEEEVRTLVELPPGVSTVGGAPSDRVRVKELPPRWLTLSVDGESVVVEGPRPFLVDRVWCPAGRKRLLLHGETIHLTDRAWLRRPGGAREEAPGSAAGTVAVARELFGGLDAPPSRAGSLRCLTGLDLGRTFPLADGQVELGRGETAGIRIRDRHVSRRHALLSVREGGLFIGDLGTANGVLVNGQRVTGARMLVDGDVVELGATFLRYGSPAREPRTPAVPASTPQPDPTPPSGPTPAPAQPATAEPPAARSPEATPAGYGPERRRSADTTLILTGVALALVGVLATWAVSREPEPGQRDPPAAASVGGAAQRNW